MANSDKSVCPTCGKLVGFHWHRCGRPTADRSKAAVSDGGASESSNLQIPKPSSHSEDRGEISEEQPTPENEEGTVTARYCECVDPGRCDPTGGTLCRLEAEDSPVLATRLAALRPDPSTVTVTFTREEAVEKISVLLASTGKQGGLHGCWRERAEQILNALQETTGGGS